MGKSLLDRIQAKLELFRLEQRYTRRRHRRSTFVSNAIYVDGEYVYQTPSSTGSSADSSATRIDALHGEKPSPATTSPRTTVSPETVSSPTTDSFPAAPERKRLNRLSSMPGFGSAFGSKKSRGVDRRSSTIR